MNKFCTGNVVSCPNGELYVVFGSYFDKLTLIPFNCRNMTIHPPEQDLYETRYKDPDYEDSSDGQPYEYLLMNGIDSYTFRASTIQDYLVNQFTKFLKDV